ncbi:ATP-binding protein [Streptomyces tirandamycinicus]|uniref:ATP-binding protein n=1 Tax=Streptomyces tirandamycinicus TaxID=2174846 RepID=UPI0022705EA5|nr:LuxR C-terminal-related transcriptional regulator [Streptomyces tirandamycinicus]MCY0982103.1 LuxR C-terminal-related transcriptional regulator [Streptomyces tirandamycinicus]
MARTLGNLPADTTSFVGRRRELERARLLLTRTRLLTLTGPGGMGKSRLARRLAVQLQRSYPQGVWLVDLAPVEAEHTVVPAVLEALSVDQGIARSPLTALVEHLKAKRLLIVLDNCEHLLRPCTALAATLLAAAPDLQLLTTSRHALGMDAETLLTIPSLTAPDPDAATRTGEEPGPSEALRLFADRAAAVLGESTLSTADSRAAARICHRLEGIPLAIELAASRLRVLSCEQILDRLDDRFRLLAGRSPAVPPRRRTLLATLDWSYDLCSPSERQLWARLSVFSGHFDLEAVEAVCSADDLPREDILDVLAGLADKSVLLREADGNRVRYSMLDTLRRYGHLRLGEAGQLPTIQRRHRDYYHRLVLKAEEEWFTSEQTSWLIGLQRERTNLRIAMSYCLGHPSEVQIGLEMAASLWSHRLGAGGLAEERQWLARALASDDSPTPARAKALWADGWLALLCGETAAARVRVSECSMLAESLGDSAPAHAAQLAGLAALFEDDFAKAVAHLEDSLVRYRTLGDLGAAWTTLFLLSLTCCLSADSRATFLAQEALAMCEAHGAQWSRSYALWTLGLQHWLTGDTRQAVGLLRESLRTSHPSYNRLAVAQSLEVLVWIRGDSHAEEAATLLGAAQNAWETVGATLPGVGRLLHHRTNCEAQLRATLGDDLFTACLRTGSALTTQQAVERALGHTPPRTNAPADRRPAALTPREYDVAQLLGQGMSDKQIAARLVISPRTAQGHVQRILRKLGLTSRAQVAAWIRERRPNEDPP